MNFTDIVSIHTHKIINFRLPPEMASRQYAQAGVFSVYCSPQMPSRTPHTREPVGRVYEDVSAWQSCHGTSLYTLCADTQ